MTIGSNRRDDQLIIFLLFRAMRAEMIAGIEQPFSMMNAVLAAKIGCRLNCCPDDYG